jgi:sugar/nucleoside kinase (ribokinase family)
MRTIIPIDPIDYLVIGHLTCDAQPDGCQLGGTAAYAALTARELGLRPGILTSFAESLPVDILADIPVLNIQSDVTTTFHNKTSPAGRQQVLTARAEMLGYHHIPETWRNSPIIHIAPVAQEVEPSLIRSLTSPIVGVTLQGWLREWDELGKVSVAEWPEAMYVLQHAGAAILSIEDVAGNEHLIEEFATSCPILVVTEGFEGSRVYWHGDVRRIRAPEVVEIDSTGAGDIFATAFFTRLYTTRDPWEAARFATFLASFSVQRKGLSSIPTPDEINACLVEVL